LFFISIDLFKDVDQWTTRCGAEKLRVLNLAQLGLLEAVFNIFELSLID
jgi:hypothetical protein